MLEPLYQPGVPEALDAIENDPSRSVLWTEIVKSLVGICEQADAAANRRHELKNLFSEPIWRVPVASGSEKEDYSILWNRDGDGDDAVIHYVGLWPPQQG